jgi:DNA polymerase-3 subunit delta'
MTYKEVYGQEKTSEFLKRTVAERKISHAYIFCGEKGSGKKLLSGLFATAILCEKGGPEPCGECISCKQAASGNNPDLKYITHEKPNVISVDEIRVQLNADIAVKPYCHEKKVYIIDEAEKMNEQAQNAMLKTIEEPPGYAVMILLVTNEKILLPTIRSRCILINLRPVEKKHIKKLLVEKHGISDYLADIAASYADGIPGRAVDFASSEEFSALRSDVIGTMKKMSRLEASELPALIKSWNDKQELPDRLSLVYMWYRDVLVTKVLDSTDGVLFKDEEAALYEYADLLTCEEIVKKLDAVNLLRERMRYNVNPEAALMLFFLSLRDRK